ncbi:phosphotransferase family protein [Frondihabitans australicus]|uniref:Choline/ethanolamine kinase n=1 Tax=Frondihabitans australicus TaxID=386892 RepID=A0A495IH71_9MICO|nr:aminoglycoside phosphotransferase [Frondihabitans australicus]RKR75337.1 choline/ethanolamine kinase [Frondihabitans australicus]
MSDETVETVETLRFNPNNATTATVERVRATDGTTRVVKRLRRAGTVTESLAHWRSSAEPSDWNSWIREADVYGDTRFSASLRGTGLGLPGADVVRHGDTIDLRLEDVDGTAGPDFSLDDHVAVASGLGRWPARPLEPMPEWASRGFLRAYATSRPADYTLVDDDAAWDQPLIRDTWPSGLRDGWQRLLQRQDDLFAVMERLPRTLCHLDAWVANVIRRPSGEVVLVDWAFAGDGAVGEDLGNYLPDAVFDLFWPAERLAELEAACWPAYLGGLREAGWTGSERDARLGLVASCVKYIWLLPLLLGAAGGANHSAYHRPAEPEHLFRQRGLALAHRVGWADEAFALLG